MIPVSEPSLGQEEIDGVLDCLHSGWISSAGSYIEQFEQQWAAYCGMPYGVSMSNGTTALCAAAAVLGLRPGDEVILPSFTIISCALAVVEAGATPVLVDSDPRTWTMDVSQVEAKITPHTRALMPVHIYGHPVDMDALLALAEKYHLAIIEDAAEAHGGEYKGRRCGGLGDLGCFSFYANKIITTGEGGMVLARTPELAEKLRSERNLAFKPERRFYHTELGHNYRLTNLQAAIGLAQLGKIEKHLTHKRWMAAAYREQFAGLEQIQLPVEEPWAKNVYWMYGLVLGHELPFDAAELARRLKADGVETRPFFLGMHEQPVLKPYLHTDGQSFPVAERLARRGLYLPSGLTLNQSQVDEVCEKVKKALKKS
jgi:perosamine synthetase